jgi:hypothetical protein
LDLWANRKRRKHLPRDLPLAIRFLELLLIIARFPTIRTFFQGCERPSEADTRFETHMVLPGNDTGEVSSPPLHLVVREHLDIGKPFLSVLAEFLVCSLRTVHTADEIPNGELEIGVVGGIRGVFSRVEKFSKLLSVELRHEGSFLD